MMTMTTTTDLTLISRAMERLVKFCIFRFFIMIGETYIFKHNQSAKYLAYYLQTPMFFDYKKQNRTGTKVIRVHGDKLAKFLVPIPPLAEQERIVAILDKFDALTNSITEGLPREIALRQQQYEHYRDLLLSFPKADVEA